MNIRFILIVLIHCLFLGKPVGANTEDRVHLIISWDLSDSMRYDGPVNWAQAGAVFFNEYFSRYQSRCQIVTVDLISWGLQAFPPVHVVLSSRDESDQLADFASKISRFKHDGTSPRSGMLHANSLVVPGYDRTVIIFISDAGVVGGDNRDLWSMVSETTDFIGVSLTGELSSVYIGTNIVPKGKRHYHAETVPVFNDILKMVLDQIGYDHCKVS